MAFPADALTTDDVNKYQGVIIAQLAATLILYIVLRFIHYVVWGHIQQSPN